MFHLQQKIMIGAIALMLGFGVGGGIGERAGRSAGERAGRLVAAQECEDRRKKVAESMREIGLCAYPHAMAKQMECNLDH